MNEAITICNIAKRKLTPAATRRREVEKIAEQLRRTVEYECEKAKMTAEVSLEGSVAKDTWIQDHVDVDVFIRVSKELTKQQLEDSCLPIAKRALRPYPIIERYADHPYVESYMPIPTGMIRVNIVPCYNVEMGKWQSATDRTPYHTRYVREHLKNQQASEVRLLKAFLRGIGSYGADIKIGGFSGMLAETLILAHGTFLQVASNFSEWTEDKVIDIENYYEKRHDKVYQIFGEPLIVIDPIDNSRNLAAAVRSEQLWNFVAASRQFLENPTRKFFAEPKVKPLTAREYRAIIKSRNSSLIFLQIDTLHAVVDVLWSQLYKTERALSNLLQANDFQVIRSGVWTDDMSLSLILFELESECLPRTRRHNGPPVARKNESARFFGKHKRATSTVAGPWIEGQKWIIQTRRQNISAIQLLRSNLKTGGRQVGVASLLANSIKKRLQLFEGNKIEPLITTNDEFAKYLRVYLSGRPIWNA
ncbi:MAG TPA: CCA tRNA nucleotidyltransferase [Candidatus Saccharimonadales bacterium]|nr:CCA tRNA nucleotidyltransferase [Candidatus Saccharimonadales bacterium]